MNWTKPFHGVTHFGKITDYRWATVEGWDGCAVLTKWAKGSGFHPETITLATVDEAKQAGEEWVARGGG